MSMLSKFAKKIGKHAPLLATLVGGPGAGNVLSLISSALGVGNSEKEIESALKTDPDAYVKLKEAEMKHKESLEILLLDERKAYLADTQSARQREVEYVKATGGRDWFQFVIGLSIILCFLVSVAAGYLVTPPVGSERLLGMTQGTLGTMTVGIVAYYFGTSKSSAEKTTIISNMKSGGSK